MPPAEKDFLGGSECNQGFYSGEVTGDNALAGSLASQLNTSIELTVFSYPVPLPVQLHAFYDRGTTWENQSIDRTPVSRRRAPGAGSTSRVSPNSTLRA